MNYSELNDYQINNLVHNIIVCGGKYTLFFSGDYDIRWTDKSDGLVVKTGKQSYGNQLKNYCNSWADAGPIIEKNHIDLIWYELDACWGAHKGMPCAYDHRPLRAAMTAFLMMQEKK